MEVRPLLAGGELPGDEMLQQVKATLDDKKVRPLTDNISVLAPEKVDYTISLTYYIASDNKTQQRQSKTPSMRPSITTCCGRNRSWDAISIRLSLS